MRKLLFPLAAGALLAASFGCAEWFSDKKDDSKDAGNFVTQAYENNGLQIIVKSVSFDDDAIKFRLVFVNKTAKPMTVDRNQLVLALPDGRSLARDEGFGTIEPIHTIAPGTSHDVFADYKTEHKPPSANLKLNGVIVDGKPLGVPDFVVTSK